MARCAEAGISQPGNRTALLKRLRSHTVQVSPATTVISGKRRIGADDDEMEASADDSEDEGPPGLEDEPQSETDTVPYRDMWADRDLHLDHSDNEDDDAVGCCAQQASADTSNYKGGWEAIGRGMSKAGGREL